MAEVLDKSERLTHNNSHVKEYESIKQHVEMMEFGVTRLRRSASW
jgi:hypothetical protein